ncbi:uncharacterized protein LOC143200039 [Rhynchophorus ferrugineus]|uniref:uncharacterized protein LOC143200039 n=1 Tax=Rhynchophorus ferrugineus TaxID=354439 RepID=UPI003FCDC722
MHKTHYYTSTHVSTLIMWLFIILFSQIFFRSYCESTPSLLQCIVNAEKLLSSEHRGILLSLPINDDSTTISFMVNSIKRQKLPWIIVSDFQETNVEALETLFNDISTHIYFSTDTDDLFKRIKGSFRLGLTRKVSKYFVILPQVTVTNLAKIKNVFNVFRKESIWNIIIFVRNTLDSTKFHIIGWFPFYDGRCNTSRTIETRDIREINTCKDGKFDKNGSVIFNTIPKVFSNCQIIVSYTNYPPYVINLPNETVSRKNTLIYYGVDLTIITHIFSYMNISLQFLEGHQRGKIECNLSAVGVLRQLANKNVDIAIGGYAQTYRRYKLFDLSAPYNFESYVWYIPQVLILQEKIISIGEMVHSTVWVLITILAILATCLVVILKITEPTERNDYKTFPGILQNIFAITFFNYTVQYLPRTPKIRLVISILLLFSLIYSIIYQTYLTSVLAEKNKSKQKYSTLKDLISNDLDLYHITNSQRYFSNKTVEDKYVKKHSRLCETFNAITCLDQVAFPKNAALFIQKGFVQYNQHRYHSKLTGELLTILPTNAVSYPQSFLMSKGFWAKDRINKMIMEAAATGLVKKWSKIPQTMNWLNDDFPHDSEGFSKNTYLYDNILGFNHLQYAFSILIIGHSVATAVFFIEIVFYKSRQRKLSNIFKR